MHPLTKEYINRFQKEPIEYPKEFYTQLQLTDYHTKLPYLYEIIGFNLRLLLALKKQDKICIYSDYDTDAVTATATMYWGLIDLGFDKDKLSFYAPDRFIEGYGMNTEAVRELAKTNDLIISVDCGVNSTEEAEITKATNCDLIITDHHQTQGVVPDCLAVINPQLGLYYQDYVETYGQRKVNFDKYLSQVLEELRQHLTPEEFKKVQELITKLDSANLTKSMPDQKLNLMSKSVTGVGVAWFCLVWLGYFLEEIES